MVRLADANSGISCAAEPMCRSTSTWRFRVAQLPKIGTRVGSQD